MSKYKIVNGVFYSVETSDNVIRVLEQCRRDGTRVVLDYGDTKTGQSWGGTHDVTGRIGISTGRIKIPLLIHNRRSHGGPAILDDCIIGIKESRGGNVLYSFNKKK